jgi:hypothetical protein
VFGETKSRNLRKADLRDADLERSFLQGTRFWETSMEGLILRLALVDSRTQIVKGCTVSTHTDPRGVPLDSIRIPPETLGQLKYCCRRLEWEDWYRDHGLLQWFVRFFWCLSDYGRSTRRIVYSFLLLSFVFAGAYTCLPRLTNLSTAHLLSRLVRASYFSIVTMTTLGFGDLHANSCATGIWFYLSHVILSLHVLIGYVLLGALITRFAIMFQGSVGPVEKPKLGTNASSWERAEDWVWCKLRKASGRLRRVGCASVIRRSQKDV